MSCLVFWGRVLHRHGVVGGGWGAPGAVFSRGVPARGGSHGVRRALRWARLCCCARAVRGRRGVRKTLVSAVFLTLWGVPGACFPSPYPGLGAGVRFWCVVAVRALLRASGRRLRGSVACCAGLTASRRRAYLGFPGAVRPGRRRSIPGGVLPGCRWLAGSLGVRPAVWPSPCRGHSCCPPCVCAGKPRGVRKRRHQAFS